MDFRIRDAAQEDCTAIMELVRELAIFEKAPEAVTTSPGELEDNGFGDNPVWWGFVATIPAGVAELSADAAAASRPASVSVRLMENVAESALSPQEEVLSFPGEEVPQTMNTAATEPGDQQILLPEEITPFLPEALVDIQASTVSTSEQVVGFALYYIRYSTWKGRRMYLEDLYIKDGFRHKGIGTALMDALIGRAKAERMHGMSWQVLDWNEPAINFYKKYEARFDNEWINVAIDV